jgi:hypothetical protein
MKDVLVRTGSALLAMVIGYIVLTVLAESLGVALKVVIALAIGVFAFTVAVWAARGKQRTVPSSTQVASHLRGGSVRVEDVHVESGQGQAVTLASDIVTPGPIDIRRASIDSERDKK